MAAYGTGCGRSFPECKSASSLRFWDAAGAVAKQHAELAWIGDGSTWGAKRVDTGSQDNEQDGDKDSPGLFFTSLVGCVGLCCLAQSPAIFFSVVPAAHKSDARVICIHAGRHHEANTTVALVSGGTYLCSSKSFRRMSLRELSKMEWWACFAALVAGPDDRLPKAVVALFGCRLCVQFRAAITVRTGPVNGCVMAKLGVEQKAKRFGSHTRTASCVIAIAQHGEKKMRVLQSNGSTRKHTQVLRRQGISLPTQHLLANISLPTVRHCT